MKRTRRTLDRKHLLLRLLQMSPLIPLLLNGIVWISVPSVLRGQILSMRSYLSAPEAKAYLTEDMVQQTISAGFIAEEEGGQFGATGNYSDRVQSIGEGLVMGTQDSEIGLEKLYEDRSAFPWDTEDPMFDSLRTYGFDQQAEVYAFAVLRAGLPQLIASSEYAPDLRYADEEALLELLPDEYTWAEEFQDEEYSLPPTPTVDTSIIGEDWKVAWYSDTMGYGELGPFPDLLSMGGYGYGDERRMVTTFSHVHGDELYASIWISHQPDPEDYVMEDDPFADPRLMELDPVTESARDDIDAVAQKYECNAYLLGPIEGKFVPIWCGPGDEETAQAIGDALSPGLVAGATFMDSGLDDDTVQAVVGEDRSVAVQAITGRAIGAPPRTDDDWAEYVAPTVLVVTVYPGSAAGGTGVLADKGPLGNAVRDIRMWIAINMHWLLNTGIALLAVSLVVSPCAFVYERNLLARERLIGEMERVQRDAHDKVYNRLSALSKRVEMTSDELSADVARSLNGVAGDIRDTVTELQDILGDTRRATAAITGMDPLRSQLEHVCRSQAERLGVEVRFDAPGSLPPISSQLGWDLQCVLEEAITNAVQHGSAAQVTVTLEPHPGALELAVVDNGSGLQLQSLDDLPPSSTGLRGMADRLLAHGGSIDMTSAGGGTTLVVTVPLSGNGGARTS